MACDVVDAMCGGNDASSESCTTLGGMFERGVDRGRVDLRGLGIMVLIGC